jgi:hypothetical protein
MSKRRFFIIVSVCVLTIIVVWVFFPGGAPKTDEARFQGWKNTIRLYARAVWWERHLPHGVGKLLRVPAHETKYLDEHAALAETLLASGYFTNVSIAVAAAPTSAVQRAQVADRLRTAFQNRDEWEFWVRSHAIVVTCRPQDVVLCRQALQE